ncbi:nitrile hydratase accessory protein [uncultured Thiodictyon sp.]|jgi:nitrile hydratase accessory protein|uniref:nitrile hydratase accessory protein n=1 Tax=uncultured Thiodictyon sp. TaxID=1846217 RepID=UPI0025E74DF8|nr:nitrile hydratase accessory protein [uncultured Thiodictyon sp.]
MTPVCKVDDDGADLDPLEMLPLLKDAGRPVFADSWEAQAFALANLLIEKGFLTRAEWVAIFSQEIKAAQGRGDPDRGDTYFLHWVAALERIMVERDLISGPALQEQELLWLRAVENTPHGVAIALENAFNPPVRDPDHHHDHHGHDHHDHDGHDHDRDLLMPMAVVPRDAVEPADPIPQPE